MASKISAGTTSTTALVYTADTSGVLQLQTNGTTTAATFDTNQNMGLGVTPSAWGGPFKAMQIGSTGSGAIYGRTDGVSQVFVGANTYYNGSNNIYQTSSYATYYAQASGAHQWYIAPSGTAGNAITFTQAMTLDNSGKLLVGNTSSIGSPYIQSQTTNSNTISSSYVWNTTDQGIVLRNPSNTSSTGVGLTMFGGSSGNSVGAIYMNQETGNSAGGLVFYTGGSSAGSPYAFERMRIDSSGNLLVGTTTNYTSTKLFIAGSADFTTSTSSTSTTGWYGVDLNASVGAINVSRNGSNVAAFFHTSNSGGLNGTPVGTISITTTATAYNTSSDRRLKSNIADLTNSGAVIDSLKPRAFTWISDNSADAGFIADELQTVLPKAVTGQPNAVDAEGKPIYQMIDASQPELIAYLVAEVQSLRARLKAANIA